MTPILAAMFGPQGLMILSVLILIFLFGHNLISRT